MFNNYKYIKKKWRERKYLHHEQNIKNVQKEKSERLVPIYFVISHDLGVLRMMNIINLNENSYVLFLWEYITQLTNMSNRIETK